MHEALPAVHPLRNIPPWKDTGYVHAKLFVSAECDRGRWGNHISPTGIPMNVHILSHCEDAPASLHTLKDNMRAVFPQCMQERDMQCGNITQTMIQVAVNEIFTPMVQ